MSLLLLALQVWGVSVEECSAIVDAFFLSSHFTDHLQPIPGEPSYLHHGKTSSCCNSIAGLLAGALAALQQLQLTYDLHVVTARQFKLEQLTRTWLARHFPGMMS